jgi:hypothetical protein
MFNGGSQTAEGALVSYHFAPAACRDSNTTTATKWIGMNPEANIKKNPRELFL